MWNKFACTICLTCTVLSVSGCADDESGADGLVLTKAIDSVQQWIIGVGGETGQFIEHNAKTLADALTGAWEKFLHKGKAGKFILDPNNPLSGTYDGVIHCKAEWGRSSPTYQGRRNNKISIELDRPRMVRKSVDSDEWELAPAELQHVHQEIDRLRQN